jgi:hypothetical protein
MLNPQNPYAPPRATLEGAGNSTGCYRSGKLLIVPAGNDLPPRCVKCNASSAQPIKPRDIFWHAQGWYLFLLVSPIVYIIVGYLVRKKARVSVGLCPGHRARRQKFIAASWGGILLGIVLITLGIKFENPAVAMLGTVLAFAGVVCGIVGVRLLLPVLINAEVAHFNGGSAAFLDSLPGQ